MCRIWFTEYLIPDIPSSPLILAAAANTASTGLTYPVQRHSTPESAWRTSASLGLGFSANEASAARSCAGVQ